MPSSDALSVPLATNTSGSDHLHPEEDAVPVPNDGAAASGIEILDQAAGNRERWTSNDRGKQREPVLLCFKNGTLFLAESLERNPSFQCACFCAV